MHKLNAFLHKIKMEIAMLFSEIQPFVRYVHRVKIDEGSSFDEWIPCDNRCFYICRGKVTVWAEDTLEELREGDVLIIPSGTKYHILAEQSCGEIIGVNFDYTLANASKKKPIIPMDEKKYSPSFRLENVAFSDMPRFNRVIHLKNNTSMTKHFLELEREFSSKMLYFEKITANILSEILFACARCIQLPLHTDENGIMREIIAYIHQNFDKPLTNREVAKQFHMHPNYISGLIKGYTGMPLHQYLINIRVYRAIDLLCEKRYSIGEIADKCGFCSIYHFSRMFTKVIGVPPSQY